MARKQEAAARAARALAARRHRSLRRVQRRGAHVTAGAAAEASSGGGEAPSSAAPGELGKKPHATRSRDCTPQTPAAARQRLPAQPPQAACRALAAPKAVSAQEAAMSSTRCRCYALKGTTAAAAAQRHRSAACAEPHARLRDAELARAAGTTAAGRPRDASSHASGGRLRAIAAGRAPLMPSSAMLTAAACAPAPERRKRLQSHAAMQPRRLQRS